MLSRLLPLTALIVGLLAPPAWAGDDPPPGAAAPDAAAPASQAANASPPAPAAQSGEADFSQEIAKRLAASAGTLCGG